MFNKKQITELSLRIKELEEKLDKQEKRSERAYERGKALLEYLNAEIKEERVVEDCGYSIDFEGALGIKEKIVDKFTVIPKKINKK